MYKLLVIVGTRPEAIKMAPLIDAFRQASGTCDVTLCVTAQHRQLLDQALSFFDIRPDVDLNLMRPNQTPLGFAAASLNALNGVLQEVRPDLTLVQGDTTTAFTGALASYYHKVPVGHVEAGLRSGEKYLPFPEEMNRELAGRIGDLHFAPTSTARCNLKREGITRHVYVTGNTVVDALYSCLEKLETQGYARYIASLPDLDSSHRVILVTGHRRESFGKPLRQICMALKDVVQRHDKVEIVYPVHLNPSVQALAAEILDGEDRVHCVPPLDYPTLVWLMKRSCMVLTDSGGIQEEAPSLGKPVLVMREATERMEGVFAGTARLVGTNRATISAAVDELLTDVEVYQRMAQAINPYGDGKACPRIVEATTRFLDAR